MAKPVAAPLKTSEGKYAPVVTREKLIVVASVCPLSICVYA